MDEGRWADVTLLGWLAEDGRVLKPDGEESLWTRHMRGEGEGWLLAWLEAEVGLRGEALGDDDLGGAP